MGRKVAIRTLDETITKKRRSEVRLQYRQGLRRAKAVSDYLLLSATEQHREATEFVVKLEEKYPDKKDVRKTVEFRDWQKKQVSLLSNNNAIAISCETPMQIPQHSDIHVNETPSQQSKDNVAEIPIQIPQRTDIRVYETPSPKSKDNVAEIPIQIPQHTDIRVNETPSPKSKDNVAEIPIQIPQHTDIRVNETPSPKSKDNVAEIPIQTPQHTDIHVNQQKELVLRIPLMSTNTKAKDIPTSSDKSVEEEEIFSIFNEIPPHVMSEIIAEIRADPYLDTIMNEFDVHEEVIEEGNVFDINLDLDLDIDIDIDIGDPLQDELNTML